MKSAIYPGSFDPVTYGHLDVIKRSANIFDELTVCVSYNVMKSSLFSVEERVKMLKEATKDLPNVKVDSFSGLTMDFAKENNVKTIFFEELVSPKVSETIADEIGAKTAVLNPIEGLTDDEISAGEDYFSVMETNLKTLEDALNE